MNSLTTTQAPLPATLRAEVEEARKFIKARHAESTRRAYAADLLAFKAWCDSHAVVALPASPEVVALFLAAQAAQGKRPSTLTRRLAAIRHLHLEAGHPSPTDSEVVKAALSGIKRTAGTAQRQVAPATADKVAAMLSTCDDSLQGRRDRALLALGFGGAFRRSELVGLSVGDLEMAEEGLRVHLAHSKTDQEGHGQVVPVLDGSRLKVKTAIEAWVAVAGIREGLLFRRITKQGRVLEALTDRSVANIIKARAKLAGLDPEQFSGHSLRAGFLTSAAASGASLFKMMDVSRHKKVDTVRGYIRQAEHFKEHAGSGFM